jgi:hypothetical protein
MNKTLIIRNFSILIASAILLTSFTIIQSEVYICKGGSSKVYHKTENCRGLKFCSANIEKVSEDVAIKLGRRKCKIEK